MTQVAAMPAMSEFLHGRARIGPNGGTTFSVHPHATGLGDRFPCHPMDRSLLVVAIDHLVVLGICECTIGADQLGRNKAPLSLVFLAEIILAILRLFRETVASWRLVQEPATM